MSETNRFSEEDIPKAVLARITKGVVKFDVKDSDLIF